MEKKMQIKNEENNDVGRIKRAFKRIKERAKENVLPYAAAAMVAFFSHGCGDTVAEVNNVPTEDVGVVIRDAGNIEQKCDFKKYVLLIINGEKMDIEYGEFVKIGDKEYKLLATENGRPILLDEKSNKIYLIDKEVEVDGKKIEYAGEGSRETDSIELQLEVYYNGVKTDNNRLMREGEKDKITFNENAYNVNLHVEVEKVIATEYAKYAILNVEINANVSDGSNNYIVDKKVRVEVPLNEPVRLASDDKIGFAVNADLINVGTSMAKAKLSVNGEEVTLSKGQKWEGTINGEEIDIECIELLHSQQDSAGYFKISRNGSEHSYRILSKGEKYIPETRDGRIVSVKFEGSERICE